jgi:hypothetical protein
MGGCQKNSSASPFGHLFLHGLIETAPPLVTHDAAGDTGGLNLKNKRNG